MEKDFEDILEECIARIRSGEADIESCLNEYPKDAEQLRPLLETAILLYQEPQPEPQPEAVSRGEQLLLSRVAEKGLSTLQREKLSSAVLPLGWRLQWVVRVAVIFAIIALTYGLIAASSHSMPGEPLYSVKIAVEQVSLAATPSEESKGRLHITLAERRMEEITEMSSRGEAEQTAKLAPVLAEHVEKASHVIVTTSDSKAAEELKGELEESAVQKLDALQDVLQESTEEMKPVISAALESSGESYATALEAAVPSVTVPPVAAKMGTIQLVVTDPPSPEAVDSIIVQVAMIEAHLAAGPDSKWVTIIDTPESFDLMQLAGGNEISLGSQEVDTGTYTKLRMDVVEATVIVDGAEHDVVVPSESLKFNRPFKVKDGQTALIVLDFNGKKSIHVTGTGQYMLKPVVSLLVYEVE